MKETQSYKFRGRWILLFGIAAIALSCFFYYSHVTFKKSLVRSFQEEQEFSVKLLSELLEHHIDEASQNLLHVANMLADRRNRADYEHLVDMMASDHRDDFVSLVVMEYDGNILYHSLGENATNPLEISEFEETPPSPGKGFRVSERVVGRNGEITTYLFYSPPEPEDGGEPILIVGQLDLRAFIKGGFSDYLGEQIGFLVADYFGDVYVISSAHLDDETIMEQGRIFNLPGHCLECHAADSFDDVKEAIEGSQTIHHLFESPSGRLLNRASGVFEVYNEKWVVSITHPYEDIQGRLTESFTRNTIISVVLIFFMGTGAFGIHRRESQQALREQYTGIIDTISVGIFRMDGEGKILNANPALADLLGVSSRNVLLADRNFFSWCDDTSVSVLVLDTLRATGRLRDVDLVMRRENGGTFRGSLSATAYHEDSTGPLLIDGVLLDITLRKNAEEDLQTATAELERQNWELKELGRMKDRLVRDVSHELKTPVAKIAMQMEILKPLLSRHNLSDAERAALDVLERSLERQQGTIRNLLDLARLESGMREYRKEEVVLDSFFEEVQREMTPVLGQAGVSVMRDVPALATFSDREMLWHVFSNLIQNAVNFRQGDHPRITITAAERNGEVEVRVADNGRGMKADVLEKAFTRFYQSTAADEGSGVGLTICRRIILDLGGRIWLESEGEGKGTTAVVVLPAQT